MEDPPSGEEISVISSTENFRSRILATISLISTFRSSKRTVMVERTASILKSIMPGVFFRIDLILAFPDHPQHPDTVREYVLSAAAAGWAKKASAAQIHRRSTVCVFMNYRSSTPLSIFSFPVLIIVSLILSIHATRYRSSFIFRISCFNAAFFTFQSSSSGMLFP